MNPPNITLRGLLVAAVLTPLLLSTAAFAQSTNRQIGTQFEVTADPLVLRPNTQPCIVPLFANFQFAFFSDTAQTFQITPPANCAGPFKKVVLEADFSENGGVQFDRTASMYVGNTNIYFGTTPEPLASLTNTWHVERDITDYLALLSVPQTGTMVLQNCTTDCPPPFNTELNGVFTVSANLEFYPVDKHHQDQAQNPPPDAVLPLVQVNSTGGINLPPNVSSPTDQLSTVFTLPTNIERVYLDVVSQSQSTDEQWYGCFPNDLSSINEVYGCGNTDFRETEISIDGKPAGISPVSPWVYTGFLPDQWVPTPGAQTLDFVPYRVNLTPFASLLSDGNPHTVALSVFNNDSFFSVTGSLLLFLDHGSSQVTGKVVRNTLAVPSPVVIEHLKGTSTVSGTISVRSDRTYTIAGFVNTSHGKVATAVSQQQNFGSTQTIKFDTVNATVLNQKTAVQNSVATTTTVTDNKGVEVTSDNFSFPIDVDFVFPVDSAPFGFTVATGQNYHTDQQVSVDGFLTSFNSTTNTVKASDVSPATSSQQYVYFDSTGVVYNCQIASTNNTLTQVSRGCAPSHH
jgi:Peptide N-acetyl-beta-D-glucosaminyl asparaginase amidase A